MKKFSDLSREVDEDLERKIYEYAERICEGFQETRW